MSDRTIVLPQTDRPAKGQYVAASRPTVPLSAAPPADGASPVSLEQHRQALRRFEGRFERLPLGTRATCPRCRQVVPATFDAAADGVKVTFDCPSCGSSPQFHHDNLYTPTLSDRPGSPTHTRAGAPIRPIVRGLPRTVQTLCPQCQAIIVGRIFVEDGAVWIEKTCPEHGHFRDCVNRDVRLYAKAQFWTFEEHAGQSSPQRCSSATCPSDCGLCAGHQSASCLCNLDLTNRCNLRCPICFANSGVTGRVYEPTYEQVVPMLQQLRDMKPVPATAIQFSGGEPTLHPHFHRIVSTAREMGFSNIQIATNGITHANLEFAKRSVEAGLHTLYLQFDGVGQEAHEATRAAPGLWEKKLACVANCRSVGLKICLVPTIIRGVNDQRVGEIIRFALDNIDVISAISFQPVSFSGRIDPSQLAAQRYTLGDLSHDIAKATGCEPLRDMFPLSVVVPLAQLLAALTGKPKIRPSCHPNCAFGTYFLVTPDGQPVPFPRAIDIEGMFSDMNLLAARIERHGGATWFDKLAIFRMFKRHFRPDQAPKGLTVKKFIHSLQGLVDKHVGRGDGQLYTYRTLMCAGMHFQDSYNFDADRVRRCVILYSTPEGIFPFCTYNCGPAYRAIIEQAHARPIAAPARAAATEEAR